MSEDISNSPDKEHFGARLTALIEKTGTNQTELAKKTGIERSALNRLVNDKRDPRPEEVEWIAAALGIPVAELVDGVTFAGEPPARQKREAELAARILTAESALQESSARIEALENTRTVLLRELEQVRTDAARKEHELLESCEREKSRLQAEAAQAEQTLRAKYQAELQRVQQAALRQEEWQRAELARARQESFAKDLEIANLDARVKSLVGQTRTLAANLSKAHGTSILSAVLGALVGGVAGAAIAKDDD